MPIRRSRSSSLLGRGLASLTFVAAWSMTSTAGATEIVELIETRPGDNISGTFLITPSTEIWAFGVGNDAFEDTSISGIAEIDGLDAGDHWVSKLISRDTWESGVDWNNIRPIGATSPSSFRIDTTLIPWQWGANTQTAFYYLSEAREDEGPPLAVLQPTTQYDAFRFFASSPGSPFATFSAADGGTITLGETFVVPEPSSALLAGLGLLGLAVRRTTRGPRPGACGRGATS